MLMFGVLMGDSGEKQKVWGGVSDPAAHDPRKFRYLVYALNPFAGTGMALFNNDLARFKAQTGEGWQSDPSQGDQLISLFEEPERVAERISLSMSLIDQDHTGTWGDGGIVVEVPEENILATGATDLGSSNSDLSLLRSRFSQQAKYTGDVLLKLSSPAQYNEVVAVANLGGNKIRLKGLFYKTNSRGEALNEAIAGQMQMHAHRLGLPLIKIQDPAAYPEDEIINEKGHLSVHLDGWRYLISGYGDMDFNETEGGKMDFISPQGMGAVLRYMARQGFGYDELSAIEKRYIKSDQERHRAKVSFNEDGSVEKIEKLAGYGKAQVRLSVSGAGYAKRVIVEEEIKHINKTMLGNNLNSDVSRAYLPMSREEVEELVQEARKGLESAQDAKVARWLEEILPDVESKSLISYGQPMRAFPLRPDEPLHLKICKIKADFSMQPQLRPPGKLF